MYVVSIAADAIMIVYMDDARSPQTLCVCVTLAGRDRSVTPTAAVTTIVLVPKVCAYLV